jgi:hypothetical protein
MRTNLKGLMVASVTAVTLSLTVQPATAQDALQEDGNIQLVNSEINVSRILDMEAELASLRARLDSSASSNYINAGDCCGNACSSCPEPCCTQSGCFASVDWLSWKARRSGMDYAHVADAGGLSALGSKNRRLGYDRANGVRLGLGYRTTTGWEVAGVYTYFHTNDAETTAPANGVIPTRIHPGDAPSGVAATAAANSSLDMDVMDFEVGRWFHPNACTDVRIFGGARWAIIDQDFNVTYDGDKGFGAYDNQMVSTPSKMDGYGLRIGGEGHWKVGRGVSLFGKTAISVLAAQFDNRYLEQDGTTGLLTDVRDTVHQAVPVLEVAMGVAYERENVEFAAGYELANWFNMADRVGYTNDGLATGVSGNDTTDLLLHGIFVRLAFIR